MIIQKQFKTINILFFFIVFLLIPLFSLAQKPTSYYPFKGFHVGITGQAEYIQKCTFTRFTGTDPAPKPRWTYGWETGLEFSYHFAKYFGVSLGLNYGTIVSFNYAHFLSLVPDYQGGWKEINKYDNFPFTTFKDNEFLFPIKLEFHYPLSKNFFINAEIGVKIKGSLKKYSYPSNWVYEYGRYDYLPFSTDIDTLYFEAVGWRKLSQVHCDLLLGIGLYYKLPYGDLLRFNCGVNISFKPIIEGYYWYFRTKSCGTFSVKNDFIYTQLSYIHTLNWQKAKKYVKNQEYSFSSKKERRGKILELLKAW